jgi:hypothetical protein
MNLGSGGAAYLKTSKFRWPPPYSYWRNVDQLWAFRAAAPLRVQSTATCSMSDKTKYKPPYAITLTILNLVAEIGELIGRYTILAEQNLTPRLRRENRIRTIQASLAIENNTLTLEQVTAVIDGKRDWACRAKFRKFVTPLSLTRQWTTGILLLRPICCRRMDC